MEIINKIIKYDNEIIYKQTKGNNESNNFSNHSEHINKIENYTCVYKSETRNSVNLNDIKVLTEFPSPCKIYIIDMKTKFKYNRINVYTSF